MRDKLIELIIDGLRNNTKPHEVCSELDLEALADHLIANGITFAKDINVPCKIGDTVWVVRSYKGIKHVQQGTISEMFFTEHMRLMITVKHIARGCWGEKVFGSLTDAVQKLEEDR